LAQCARVFRNGDDRFRHIRAIPTTTPPIEKEFIRRVRASSLPPERSRSPSPPPGQVLHPLRRSSQEILAPCVPTVTRYYPEYDKCGAPWYSYTTKMPLPTAADSSRRMLSVKPLTFGPKHLTGCSTFPTMRHTSYSLLEPIERYRYHSGHKPYASTCNTYLGYPTPTYHR